MPLFPDTVIWPHVHGVFRVALQVVALHSVGAGGDQCEALRVGGVDELLLGFGSLDEYAEPGIGVFMTGTDPIIGGDQGT